MNRNEESSKSGGEKQSVIEEIMELDKQHTPFLLQAIDACRSSELVVRWNVDISRYYIQLTKVNDTSRYGKPYYSVWFYPKEITQDNWMDGPSDEIDISVDMDGEHGEVLKVYAGRN